MKTNENQKEKQSKKHTSISERCTKNRNGRKAKSKNIPSRHKIH